MISTLSDDEIRAILALFSPANSSNARNQAIFMLMLDTGLRMGELINLKMDDIQMNERLLRVLVRERKKVLSPWIVMRKRRFRDIYFGIVPDHLA